MLSPVGEWNTIHAAPLIWTTTRPMTTYRSFPEYTSGLALNYLPQNGKLPEMQLFWHLCAFFEEGLSGCGDHAVGRLRVRMRIQAATSAA